jgi:hypothetical protein
MIRIRSVLPFSGVHIVNDVQLFGLLGLSITTALWARLYGCGGFCGSTIRATKRYVVKLGGESLEHCGPVQLGRAAFRAKALGSVLEGSRIDPPSTSILVERGRAGVGFAAVIDPARLSASPAVLPCQHSRCEPKVPPKLSRATAQPPSISFFGLVITRTLARVAKGVGWMIS